MSDKTNPDNVVVNVDPDLKEPLVSEPVETQEEEYDMRFDPQARAKAANMTGYVSIVCDVGLTIIKFIAGYLGHSSALVADAFHSLSDLFADFICVIVSCMAKMPADERHPYGHGRIELIGSVGVAAILLIAAWYIGKESIEKMRFPDEGILAWYTALVAGISIVVKEALYWYCAIVGKKINSPVIIANAWHHRTDAISSVVALLGTLITLIWKWPYADPAAGFLVALMIAFIAIKMVYESMCTLADRVPTEIIETLNNMLSSIPEVEGFSDVRAREMGAFLLVDLKLYVHAGTHIEDAEVIQNRVEKLIKKEIKNVTEVMVRMTTVHDEKNNQCTANIYNKIRDAVLAVPEVNEITHMRVFGPEPYAVDVHINCSDFVSFCEQHKAIHAVKHVIYDIAPMKSVHVGLECCGDHDVQCTEDGPCIVIQHEKAEEKPNLLKKVPLTQFMDKKTESE